MPSLLLFDKINSLGATVVVVTHDHDLVHQFDHRVVTIENGRIISDVPAKYSVPVAPRRPESVKKVAPAQQAEPETVKAEAEKAAEYEENTTEEVAENGQE